MCNIIKWGAAVVQSVDRLCYELDDWGLFLVGAIMGIFSSHAASRTALKPTQSPIQRVPVFFPRVKEVGREVDHSPPSSAEVKNEWIYTSTLPVRLHGVMLN
jgi:hypothetical protein